MLKFVIGDSLSYKMSAGQIFAMCLKWIIDQYKIKNKLIEKITNQLIDFKNAENEVKFNELKEIMNEVMNMSPE